MYRHLISSVSVCLQALPAFIKIFCQQFPPAQYRQVLLFALLFCSSYVPLKSQPANHRVLVVSGGGCRGAWGAGLAKRLTEEHGVYNVAFGTSTGSLMIPLILQNRFGDLERGYTTVEPKDIFNVNPFRKDGEFCWLNALVRMVRGRPTLGETDALRKLIDTFLEDKDYNLLREQKKLFGVGVVNMKNGEQLIKYSADFDQHTGISSPKTMKNWIWASCNQPFLMTYYPSKKYPDPEADGYFVDGGLRETVPLSAAIDYATWDTSVKFIDVIINEPMAPVFKEKNHPTTLLKSLKRATDIWRAEVINNDVLIAAQDLTCNRTDRITVQLRYFPTELYPENDNDLLFKQENMRKMWKYGYDGKEDQGPKQTIYYICRKKAKEYFIQMQQYNQRFRGLYLEQ